MKSAMRSLALAVVIGLSMMAWSSKVGSDLVGAQVSHKPGVMKRIYTGTDGLSHVEDIPLDEKTVMEKIANVRVSVSEPGSFIDWHPGGGRRYIINLTSGGQVEVAEGKVDLPAGSIEYIDDLSGKGHTTSNVGKEPRMSIWLEFADQKQRIGPLNAKPASR
jgi:hypothetical protein